MLTDRFNFFAASGGRSHPCREMLKPSIEGSAFKSPWVAGTVLNVINDGDPPWVYYSVSVCQAAFNFAAPFGASIDSATRNPQRCHI